ncbi:two-component system chemotaxis response regulator CheY [Pseudoduganella lurida]|uniref:Two-component system chemotaxis response regulator CheY n=1 Tax=Pseudoduganella lurida TaxID=1036180 RepID=A0A562R8J9_9BURK|nr:response regulator [Pseudoduganella lurida]TWI65203.1 two-component system chemotaxis response regulator CheY [Pseudoduganella lurida]
MKVLVVDDDVVSRMMLMHLIDSSGRYEIVEAEDGAEAWAQLQGGLRPAICFCDLRMPRLSGIELLQHVRGNAALAALPFVLVSSASDGATLDQARQAGVSGYLVKPFEPAQVRAQLAALIPQGAHPDAEEPSATQARLGIDAARLQAYLAGFEQQLRTAQTELAKLHRQGERETVSAQLERLHAGCTTLGLTGAAALLHPLPPADAPDTALEAVLESVRHQLQRLHA